MCLCLLQAQKKREQFEAHQRARARQLEAETAAESHAAMVAAMTAAPAHVSWESTGRLNSV